jgi:hypothetical protein
MTTWANVGVFEQLHLQVLDRLGGQGRLDWERASVDAMSVRAKRGGTTWAQIRSTVASLEASSTWSATAAGAADLGGDRGQRQRHQHVPGRRGGHPAGPDAGWAAAHPTAAVHADKTSHAVRRQAEAGRSCRRGGTNAVFSW